MPPVAMPPSVGESGARQRQNARLSKRAEALTIDVAEMHSAKRRDSPSLQARGRVARAPPLIN